MRTKRFLLALLVLFLAMASLVLIEAVRLFHLFQAQNASDRPGAQLARLEEYVQQHSRVKPGRVLFEIKGVAEADAREALRLAQHKLPLKTKIIARETAKTSEGGEA